jgi:hypothetical protein
MSRRYYRLRLGEQKWSVVEGSAPSLAGPGVEISIDAAGWPSTAEFHRLLAEIVDFVHEERPSHFVT